MSLPPSDNKSISQPCKPKETIMVLAWSSSSLTIPKMTRCQLCCTTTNMGIGFVRDAESRRKVVVFGGGFHKFKETVYFHPAFRCRNGSFSDGGVISCSGRYSLASIHAGLGVVGPSQRSKSFALVRIIRIGTCIVAMDSTAAVFTDQGRYGRVGATRT